MAHLFEVVVIPTAQPRTVRVVAETPEEAQAKVSSTLTEGESLQQITDAGEVTL